MMYCDQCHKPLPPAKHIRWKMHREYGQLANEGITAVGMYCSVRCFEQDTAKAQKKRLQQSIVLRGSLLDVFRSTAVPIEERYIARAESPFRDAADMMYLGGDYNFLKYYGR
jgi:hypothetical protein